MATEIRMSLSDWQEKQARVNELEEELAEVKRALDAARLEGGDGDNKALAEALGKALAIVSFAVANMAPRMFPGWPHEALDAFAKALPDLPGVPDSFKETSNDLRIFARDAREWEEARANGTHEAKFLEENSGSSMSLPDGALDGFAGGAAGLIKP